MQHSQVAYEYSQVVYECARVRMRWSISHILMRILLPLAMYARATLATHMCVWASIVLPLASRVRDAHSRGFCKHTWVNVKLLVICTVQIVLWGLLQSQECLTLESQRKWLLRTLDTRAQWKDISRTATRVISISSCDLAFQLEKEIRGFSPELKPSIAFSSASKALSECKPTLSASSETSAQPLGGFSDNFTNCTIWNDYTFVTRTHALHTNVLCIT